MKYSVKWFERVECEIEVEANSPEEAARLIEDGKFHPDAAKQLPGAKLDSDFTVLPISRTSQEQVDKQVEKENLIKKKNAFLLGLN